ncbi:hypothetical protein ACTMU2_09505 [Cupriavidus basilensis]
MIFRGAREIELAHFDDPTPGPGEAVIEMKASGMCGTDLHYYRHGMAASLEMLGLKDRIASDRIIGEARALRRGGSARPGRGRQSVPRGRPRDGLPL